MKAVISLLQFTMRLPSLQLFIIFVIFRTVCSSVNSMSINQSLLLSEGILTFLSKFNLAKLKTIHFVKDRNDFSDDVVNDILRVKTFEFAFQIENYEKAWASKAHKHIFSVFLFHDSEIIGKFFSGISHESFFFNGYFLVVLNDFTTFKMKNLFDLFWKKFIFNVDVLVKSGNSQNLSIFTFMPFKSDLCGDTTPMKINEFDGKNIVWATDVYFPKKFRNLQKCPIKIGSIGNFFSVMFKTAVNQTKYFYGFEVDLLKELASTLNFKPDFKIFPYEVGLISKNKTSTGMIKRVQENEVDLICGSFSLQQQRREVLSDTRSFYSDKIILVTPKSMTISPIRKLFIPFDLFTWISIAIVLLVAFVVLALLKKNPQRFQNFIIGRNISNNFLNVWNVLLGGSQVKLPFRNFARFLLMSFIMLSLIVRSSYSGSLFKILTNDIFNKDISSIHELNNLGYTFYIYESLAIRLKDEKIMKR